MKKILTIAALLSALTMSASASEISAFGGSVYGNADYGVNIKVEDFSYVNSSLELRMTEANQNEGKFFVGKGFEAFEIGAITGFNIYNVNGEIDPATGMLTKRTDLDFFVGMQVNYYVSIFELKTSVKYDWNFTNTDNVNYEIGADIVANLDDNIFGYFNYNKKVLSAETALDTSIIGLGYRF